MRELIDSPRHLSQHVGGFVITRGRLDEVVPIENAAMEERTVIEWNKEDLESLGLLKVDVLALGMLSCLRRGFEMLQTKYGETRTLAIQDEDQATYKMIQRADTIGVFQIESRAQMSMLPRLRPKEFYDLVIEVHCEAGRSKATWCIPICGGGVGLSFIIRTSQSILGKRSVFRCSRSTPCGTMAAAADCAG